MVGNGGVLIINSSVQLFRIKFLNVNFNVIFMLFGGVYWIE